MIDPVVKSAPLSLWLTDRSRYTTGTGRCKRERYLRNHFGPTGYGIVRKAESLPLMTGSYMHVIIERLMGHMQQTDMLPNVEVVRAAIAAAFEQYEARIAARGFRGILAGEHTDYVVREQQHLIAGLTWALMRNVLPWIHANYRILQSEVESIYVLGCTCGLGSAILDAEAHDAKGCLGIGQMIKQDAVAQHRVSGNLAYFESKTTGWGGDNWAPQWETKPQLSIGAMGLAEKYGKPITENFVIALYKGARKQNKPKDAFEDPITRQESNLVYGYLKPGNPPLATDDWQPAYEWTDPISGQTKRVSRAHQKTGVWELANTDWPEWVQRKAADPTLTTTEVWVASLPQSVLDSAAYLIGPLNRQDVQIAALKDQIVGEELHWQQITWELYELSQAIGDEAQALRPHLPRYAAIWADPRFQQRLNRLVPASWECRKFGVKHECEFKRLCFQEAGWESPLELAGFVPRRPHHQPELEVAISRGLLPEQGEEESEDE